MPTYIFRAHNYPELFPNFIIVAPDPQSAARAIHGVLGEEIRGKIAVWEVISTGSFMIVPSESGGGRGCGRYLVSQGTNPPSPETKVSFSIEEIPYETALEFFSELGWLYPL